MVCVSRLSVVDMLHKMVDREHVARFIKVDQQVGSACMNYVDQRCERWILCLPSNPRCQRRRVGGDDYLF